jgi:hypothetical protein
MDIFGRQAVTGIGANVVFNISELSDNIPVSVPRFYDLEQLFFSNSHLVSF